MSSSVKVGAQIFPGQRLWPTLQSLYFDEVDGLKRCLVAMTIGREGNRLELSDVLFLEDARRWSQAPLSLELQFNDKDQSPRSPVRDRAICCPEGCTLLQRVGAGFCHLLLIDAKGGVKCQRRWDADLGQIDVDFDRQMVYIPHYAKGVVQTLSYPDMQPSQLMLCHQRLITAERVVAKSRYVAVDGCVLDNEGTAVVPGLAVFDTDQSELLCAAPLPEDLLKGWTFTVTNDGRVMLAESQVDRGTNRFRLFGFTRSGDLDFTVKLLAAMQQPWRLQLVKDNLGRDFIREEDGDSRVLVPIEVYLRKERLDQQLLATASDLAASSGFPQSI